MVKKIKRKKRSGKPSRFYDPVKHGVSQTSLYKFMACRKLCDIELRQGWEVKGVKAGMTYGTIVHGCLEYAYRDIMSKKLTTLPTLKQIRKYVNRIAMEWRKENPRCGKYGFEVLETSCLFAESVLPVYFDYWKKDLQLIRWEELEGYFREPYRIQNGQYAGIKIPIIGKKDGQYRSRAKDLWLFETKSKSRVDEETLLRTLVFELQVNVYLWALKTTSGEIPAGVLYNIVRRPGLKLKQKESLKQFATRCVKDVLARPDFYFYRYEISFTEEDILKWELEFDGLMSDFYGWYIGNLRTYKNTGHCENKYGKCEAIAICSDGDYSRFTKRQRVYKELEDM